MILQQKAYNSNIIQINYSKRDIFVLSMSNKKYKDKVCIG